MTATDISALLKDHGVRPTPQRIEVYRYLAEHPVHATADVIYDALAPDNPSFSKTTVYNTIKLLAACGLAHPVVIDGSCIRYDADTRDHGHFKCTVCGRVFDFAADFEVGETRGLQGFQVDARDLYYYGKCPDCAGNPSSRDGKPSLEK